MVEVGAVAALFEENRLAFCVTDAGMIEIDVNDRLFA
jgi:hypothetical protein